MSKTRKLVEGIRYIPTLPMVLTHILETLNDDRSTAADLEDIVKNDQALSSKLLSVANSAYYGFRHQIVTVQRAVVAIGYDEVRNICLGASLMAHLNPMEFSDSKGAIRLWLHSLAVAEVSSVVAKSTGAMEPGAAFSAGLLHDLGIVVLMAYFPEEMRNIRELMSTENLTYRQAEQANDADHTSLGQALGNLWDLPPVLNEVMAFHHTVPDEMNYPKEVSVIHLANEICNSTDWSKSMPETLSGLKRRALEELDIDATRFRVFQEQCQKDQERIMDLFKLLAT